MNSIAWVTKNCRFAAGLNFDRPIETNKIPIKDRRKIGPAEVIPAGDLYRDKNVRNLPAPEDSGPLPQAVHNMLKEKLEQALNTLRPLERNVIKMFYGLGDEKEQNVHEISKRLKLEIPVVNRALEKGL